MTVNGVRVSTSKNLLNFGQNMGILSQSTVALDTLDDKVFPHLTARD